jgi:outer membrane protein TolC
VPGGVGGLKTVPGSIFLTIALLAWSSCCQTLAQSENNPELRPSLEPVRAPLTLTGAIRVVETRYPKLLETAAEARAYKENVRVQRIKEYMPDLTVGYQNVVGSHNRLTQTLFGSSILPTTPGPGPDSVSMRGSVFTAGGFLVEWDPLDFGLHKARIDSARAQSNLADAKFGASLLQAQVDAASRYLDALVMREQIAVAQANVERFADFSRVVHAQVESGLEAAADASLADVQLADARNDLIRARLSYDLALASLAQALGLAGEAMDINPGGIAVITQPPVQNQSAPIFDSHPLALQGKAFISTYLAQRNVLSKEYYPRLRWLGGMNFRGSTFHTNRGDVPVTDISAALPYIPNWNIGLMVDWTPSEIFRIRAEKRVIDHRIEGARQGYAAVVQSLQTEDAQARARVRAAAELAASMPAQVRAAELAARQSQSRYRAGLATIADVAQANQILAQSRVKQAVANVGVWRALLEVASVHGDLKPFIAEADRATRGIQ